MKLSYLTKFNIEKFEYLYRTKSVVYRYSLFFDVRFGTKHFDI